MEQSPDPNPLNMLKITHNIQMNSNEIEKMAPSSNNLKLFGSD